ncbi:MAG: hypothetical protein ACJAZM_001309 [Cyclobacteriaceae bacterium]|jgi:hypothetical protein
MKALSMKILSVVVGLLLIHSVSFGQTTSVEGKAATFAVVNLNAPDEAIQFLEKGKTSFQNINLNRATS